MKFSMLILLIFASGVRGEEPVVINLKAIAGFRFDIPRVQVKPGSRVRLTLQNADHQMHNLAVVRPGTRMEIVNASIALGPDGPAVNFVPKSKNVIASTRVLAPGQKQTIEFTLPKASGVYQYICTYPGHGTAMFGAMYVGGQKLPPLDKDSNVPPPAPKTGLVKNDFLKPLTGAKVVRDFMPNCGPASIAVGLPMAQSLCWDAGQCRLRYAWSGGFISIPYRKKDQAKIEGKVYYSAPIDGFPIRFSDTNPKVEFLGYRLIESYPQFRYTVDGVQVHELIQLRADGNGIVRLFQIDSPRGPVRFVVDPKMNEFVSSPQGKFVDGVLTLSAAKAKRFIIELKAPIEKDEFE